MKGTVFYKMSGSGNDFIMFDGRVVEVADWTPERIRAACDRRSGIGADGVVILTPDGPGRVRMTFFNCDGSEAAMCGNAALCSTRLSAHLNLASPEGMVLVTGAGTFTTRCAPGDHAAELLLPDLALPAEPPIPLGPGECFIQYLVVGVPHLVVRVADVENVDLQGRGRELRFHPSVEPEGANVNFVSGDPASREPWKIRTYERGVEDETLACGTGAVAAAVILANHLNTRLPLNFETRSGKQLTAFAALSSTGASDVRLGGEGRLIYQGMLQGAPPSTSVRPSAST